jgi:hypothetical protein
MIRKVQLNLLTLKTRIIQLMFGIQRVKRIKRI